MGWPAKREAIWLLLLWLGALAGCSATPAGGTTRLADADGMRQVAVPAGDFLMGSALLDPLRLGWEKPRHRVYLDAFWIDQTEITNAQFAHFVEVTGYLTDAERAGASLVFDPTVEQFVLIPGASWRRPRGADDAPFAHPTHAVVQISWHDATAYCRWAGRRLPTEAEWEKAARGTDGRRYPWGNQSPAGHLLNYADRTLGVAWADQSADDGYPFTAPAGSYPTGASPYGALDMAGNVWEWVSDWFDPDYYDYTPVHNPPGPAAGVQKVVRGGGWSSRPRGLRTAHRDRLAPAQASNLVGFRCAQDPK